MPESPTSFKIHSDEVGDDFEIIVQLPESYHTKKSYPLVLYLDAGINSGKKMPALIKEKKTAIVVGVKHLGNFKKLRRRNFIPAHIEKEGSYYSDDPNYGQAEKFHRFLLRNAEKINCYPNSTKNIQSRKMIKPLLVIPWVVYLWYMNV